MSKFSFAFVLLVLSSPAWADTASCTIEIEDVNSGSKSKVEHSFAFNSGSEAQRKNFVLPGGQFSCTLAFFDPRSGTMLSCKLDELGHEFMQSDRSGISEGGAKNNLSFRYKSSFYILQSYCK
ncbi:MAG: hypothetical protein OQL11_06665 [Gammaproteobacteria bacterium]|nr:hypothetical protein [Gammaproteobacteria bacterium]